MKKILAGIIIACMLALLVTSTPVASAGDDTGVLVSHVDMAYSPDWGYWRGTVIGPLHGVIGFWEQPALIVGNTDYFAETFVITTSKGVLQGTDEGVYNLTTGDFWAHGTVTKATGHWAFAVGYTLFEWGTTTTPFVFPMIATDMPLVLTPAQPTPAHDREVAVTYGDMAFGAWGYWRGTVSGDMRGTEEIHELEGTVIGDKLYFLEVSTITTSKGVAQFVDRGVYNLTTGTFFAQGHVMQASGGWKFLLGYTSLGWGTTSDPNVMPITTFAPTILVEG